MLVAVEPVQRRFCQFAVDESILFFSKIDSSILKLSIESQIYQFEI
jgi:hypothetical protein